MKNGLIFLSILFIGIICSPSAIAAKEDPVTKMEMTIISTTEDDFITDKGNFRMNADTIVKDANGKDIQLRYVSLPCVADVEFEVSKETYQYTRAIVVKKVIGKKYNEVMSKDPI
jgi:hypothetical protein